MDTPLSLSELTTTVKSTLEEQLRRHAPHCAWFHGHDLKNALPKAEIFKLCKEIEEAL